LSSTQVPIARQFSLTDRAHEPTVLHEVDLIARRTPSEYAFQRKSARMFHAELIQCGFDRSPGLRLGTEARGLIRHFLNPNPISTSNECYLPGRHNGLTG
jgi:hypothetical protein